MYAAGGFFRETDIQRNVGLQEIAKDFKGSGHIFAHYCVCNNIF